MNRAGAGKDEQAFHMLPTGTMKARSVFALVDELFRPALAAGPGIRGADPKSNRKVRGRRYAMGRH